LTYKLVPILDERKGQKVVVDTQLHQFARITPNGLEFDSVFLHPRPVFFMRCDPAMMTSFLLQMFT
jgi:hypothetical protein